MGRAMGVLLVLAMAGCSRNYMNKNDVKSIMAASYLMGAIDGVSIAIGEEPQYKNGVDYAEKMLSK